jgi:hypothetical protein
MCRPPPLEIVDGLRNPVLDRFLPPRVSSTCLNHSTPLIPASCSTTDAQRACVCFVTTAAQLLLCCIPPFIRLLPILRRRHLFAAPPVPFSFPLPATVRHLLVSSHVMRLARVDMAPRPNGPVPQVLNCPEPHAAILVTSMPHTAARSREMYTAAAAVAAGAAGAAAAVTAAASTQPHTSCWWLLLRFEHATRAAGGRRWSGQSHRQLTGKQLRRCSACRGALGLYSGGQRRGCDPLTRALPCLTRGCRAHSADEATKQHREARSGGWGAQEEAAAPAVCAHPHRGPQRPLAAAVRPHREPRQLPAPGCILPFGGVRSYHHLLHATGAKRLPL